MSFAKSTGLFIAGAAASALIFAVVEAAISKVTAPAAAQDYWVLIPKSPAVQSAIGTTFDKVVSAKVIVKPEVAAPEVSFPLQDVTVAGQPYWGALVSGSKFTRGDYIFAVDVETPEKDFQKDFGVTLPHDIGLILPAHALGVANEIVFQW